MWIEVTQKDIDTGGRRGDSCPIFQAISRQRGYSQVWVFPGYLVFNYEGVRNSRSLKELVEVYKFIRSWDEGKEVKPFKFWLPLF